MTGWKPVSSEQVAILWSQHERALHLDASLLTHLVLSSQVPRIVYAFIERWNLLRRGVEQLLLFPPSLMCEQASQYHL